MNFAQSLVKMFGVSTMVPIVETLAIEQLAGQGRDAIKRAVALPEGTERAICAKTGADLTAVLTAREKFENDFADYVLAHLPAPAAAA